MKTTGIKSCVTSRAPRAPSRVSNRTRAVCLVSRRIARDFPQYRGNVRRKRAHRFQYNCKRNCIEYNCKRKLLSLRLRNPREEKTSQTATAIGCPKDESLLFRIVAPGARLADSVPGLRSQDAGREETEDRFPWRRIGAGAPDRRAAARENAFPRVYERNVITFLVSGTGPLQAARFNVLFPTNRTRGRVSRARIT